MKFDLGDSTPLYSTKNTLHNTQFFFSSSSSSHQQADGGEADVELLVLQAEAARHVHHDLQAGAGHGGQEVRHHQLQALERRPDQGLPGEWGARGKGREKTVGHHGAGCGEN